MTDLPLTHLPPPRGTPFDLLAGIRVVDLTTSIAGPYGTMLLADLGAEVIKIERPGPGDDARHWGPPFLDGQSLWFVAVNRNKESVGLDYATPTGHALLLELVAKADVVVVNQVPRRQVRLRTDYETLKAARPDLIHVSLTGYGLTGARADQPCYDLIAEGRSGVMDLTGELENLPQKVGTPAADLLAGMDAALATVAALFARERGGQGRQIDVSLVESMSRFMVPRLSAYLGSGELPQRSGARDSVVAIYQVFATADEPLTLAVGNDAIWQRFARALDRPDWAEDPRFATNADRRAARAELVDAIQQELHTQPRDHWLARFAAHDVPAGPIQRLDQIAADADLLARDFLYRMTGATGTAIPQINTGILIDGAANAPRSPPPALGADGPRILASLLGKTDSEIEAFKADGII